MGNDRLVDALAAFEARSDEVAGIPSIDRRTRGALELTPRAARLERDAVGKRGAGEDHRAPSVALSGGVAPQADRMTTPAAARALLEEVVELMTAGVAPQRLDHGSVRVPSPTTMESRCDNFPAQKWYPARHSGTQRYPGSATGIQ